MGEVGERTKSYGAHARTAASRIARTAPYACITSRPLKPAARQVHLDGRPLALTSIEYDLLEYLAREVGRVVPREELMAVVGRREPSPFDRSVDVHVSHLRRKLRVHARRIVTVRGVGYMLAALVG